MLSAQLMAQGSTMWRLSSLQAQLRKASSRGKWHTSPRVHPLARNPCLPVMTSHSFSIFKL